MKLSSSLSQRLYVATGCYFVYADDTLFRISRKTGEQEDWIAISSPYYMAFDEFGWLYYIDTNSDGLPSLYKVPADDFSRVYDEPFYVEEVAASVGEPAVLPGVTVAPANYASQQDRSDMGKTVGVFQKKMNFEPVVGWLVCIEGPEKGKDYKIYGKNNTVGRSEKMDICIKGDSTISRENHARLAYDGKHNAFHLIPAESTNTIYLNDEPIYVPAKLKDYDVIEFGDCKMIFVPFCNALFTWQTGLKQD